MRDKASMLKSLPLPLRILCAAVLLNYFAQIPYDLHLYGLNLNPRGAMLLGSTLLWFLIGFFLLLQKNPIGYWLTLAYVGVQVIFYFNNEILLALVGYGFPYHLLNFSDPIIWATEMIGSLNGVVAAYSLYYLLRHKSSLTQTQNHAASSV